MSPSAILSQILMRHTRNSLMAQTADDGGICERVATALYTAYHQLQSSWPWPPLADPATTTTPDSNGKVLKTTLGNPLWVKFYPDDSLRHPLDIDRQDSTAYYLPIATQVHYRAWPALIPYIPTGVTSGPVGTARAIIYVHATKNFYREKLNSPTTLIEDHADTNKWDPAPALWPEAQTYILYKALADLLGNTEQERAQARDLLALAADEFGRLEDLYRAQL